MAHINSDVCREIFLRLPAKYVVRSRAVCKSWRAVIDHPSFARALTNKQLSSNTNILIRNRTGPPFILFDLETLNFTDGLQKIVAHPLDYTRTELPLSFDYTRTELAVCEGLILVAPEEPERNCEISNPLTHERLELPQSNSPALSSLAAHGIGYDRAADDYKAVVIARHDDVYETRVYSLKSDSWRKIMNLPCPIDGWELFHTRGVFLNGALHWMSWENIFVLDLGTETYRQLKPPPLDLLVGLMVAEVQLDALGGCLVVSDFGKNDYEFSRFDVWVMNDYGAEDSWVKLFSLQHNEDILRLGPDLKLVAYMKHKMQFFMQSLEGLLLFDVETNSLKMIDIHSISSYSPAQVFDGSVFRLHDNCGVSGSVTMGKRIKEMKSKVKMTGDAELLFCVRDVNSFYMESHDSCYEIDSTCLISSEEEDDEYDDEEQ